MADMTFEAYLSKMRRARDDLPQVLAKACRKATIKAVEAAANATPPKTDTGRGPYIGTNTVTGELKAHWSTDSTTTPVISDDTITTTLANDKEYASYVNDGHRLDRHFVPGLHVNPNNGLLEYDPDKNVGIVVGTKTKYVKGEFMTDKAKKAYQETLEAELDAKVKELFT